MNEPIMPVWRYSFVTAAGKTKTIQILCGDICKAKPFDFKLNRRVLVWALVTTIPQIRMKAKERRARCAKKTPKRGPPPSSGRKKFCKCSDKTSLFRHK